MKALRKRDTDLYHVGQAYGEAVRRAFHEATSLRSFTRIMARAESSALTPEVLWNQQQRILLGRVRKTYRAARRVLVLRDLIRRAAADA